MTALFAYKCLRGLDFMHWFRERSTNYPIRLDTTIPSTVPRISIKHSLECINYRGPMIWNDLSLDIREPTFDCFKITLKRLLLARLDLSR